jgi:hypothetical protein
MKFYTDRCPLQRSLLYPLRLRTLPAAGPGEGQLHKARLAAIALIALRFNALPAYNLPHEDERANESIAGRNRGEQAGLPVRLR